MTDTLMHTTIKSHRRRDLVGWKLGIEVVDGVEFYWACPPRSRLHRLIPISLFAPRWEHTDDPEIVEEIKSLFVVKTQLPGPILDTFNRADEEPISSSWATPIFTGADQLTMRKPAALREAIAVIVEDILLMDSPEGDSPRNIAANLRRVLPEIDALVAERDELVENLRLSREAHWADRDAWQERLVDAVQILREHEYVVNNSSGQMTEGKGECLVCGWPQEGHDGPGRYKGNAANTHEEGCSLDAVLNGQPAHRLRERREPKA